MSGRTKIVTGRIREAFGSLTGSKRLKAKGKAQQTLGKVEKDAKEGVDAVRQSAKQSIEKAKEKAENTVEKAKKS